MADRSANKLYESKGMSRLAVPIANGITLPVGTLVQSESGFANHYDGTATLLGIVLTPDPAVYVDASGPVITGIPVASSTTVGQYVYCDDSDLDNATITQPTTDAPIGWIVGWRSATDADVRLFTALEHTIGVEGGGTSWT